ncbi:ribonuclease H2 subunit B isoform X2 [Rhinatrema bivittatum]|uniref:ribonuclease H2 subunit B isoform X2 n=1 Tax=Rhinatrema bivittatum TaxID=194408 RepID=UPI001129B134|nr:ribonuclease H2 subunit B isoform X2 [Rhinatrema bivittatum]
MLTKKTRETAARGDQWVFMAKDSLLDLPKKSEEGALFTRLRNPSTGEGALFLFSSHAQQLFEIKAFNEDYHSWFIGQSVQHDGRFFFATPMDSLFLLLYYLMKAEKEQGKFQPVDQVVVDEEFPSSSILLQCTQAMRSLHHVTTEKEIGNKKFYKYSKEKTLKWLKKKVEQTVKALKNSNICVGGAVHSATFIRSKQVSDVTEEGYTRYAHGLVSEYIPEDLSADLSKYLGLAELPGPAAQPPVKVAVKGRQKKT